MSKFKKYQFWYIWPLLIVVLYSFLLSSFPYGLEIDGFWHITLSKKMWAEGIIYRLPELAFTLYNEYYREHHFLFQVLYMPFALIPDPYLALKVAAIFYASLTATVFIFWLRKQNVPWPNLWIGLYLFGSSGFLFRMLNARVQSVSLFWLLLIVWCLHEKRYRWLAALSFTYVWLYDAFFLVFPIVACFTIVDYCVEKTIPWKSLGSIAGGVIAGIVINPYFPQNIESYYYNIVRSIISTQNIVVGGEWQPYTVDHYIVSDFVIILPFLAMTLYLFEKRNRTTLNVTERKQLWSHWLIALVFIGLSLKSKRFIEYMPPFAIMFSALSARYLPVTFGKQRWFYVGLASICAYVNLQIFYRSSPMLDKLDCYKNAGAWIHTHLPAGELVYNADWDDFPPLYIQAPHVRYIVGLDPLFMATHKRELYDIWRSISNAEASGPLAEKVWQNFQARYIFSEKLEHAAFAKRLLEENQVIERFGAPQCGVFEIKPEFTQK